MKTFFRGIRRYLASAFLIIVLILVSNFVVLFYMMYSTTGGDGTSSITLRNTLESAGQDISLTENGYRMSKKGRNALKEYGFVWAMALNEEGKVIWEWKLPDDIPRQYSVFDVASFFRWYLNDYPVRVWNVNNMLLVCAQSPDEIAILNLPVFVQQIVNFPYYIQLFVIVNLAVILLFVVIFGWRFYVSVRPISEGIEGLSRKEPVHLREKGSVRELAEKLNATSDILMDQEEKLSRRDQARADWIAGVSHDIRTPLTLIVGYSERLMDNPLLGEEEKEMAQTIQRQSGLIKQLIEDLNLTSKLSYDTFPLHLTTCAPAQTLRECIADIYNSGLQPQYSIEIAVTDEAEKFRLPADEPLMKRAIHNVLGNSIRHNPEGCQVNVRLSSDGQNLHYLFEDSGPGIPDEIVACLDAEEEDKNHRQKASERREAVSQPHIMGMRLTRQIVKLHGGSVYYYKRKNGNYDCGFVVPGDYFLAEDVTDTDRKAASLFEKVDVFESETYHK